MEREESLTVRKKSQNSKVTLARVFRLMGVMHKEMKRAKIPFSKGLSKTLISLMSDYEKYQSEPPPIPVDIQQLRGDLLVEQAKVKELSKGLDEMSTIALQFKAEAMAERVENKRFIEVLADLLPKKIREAMEITTERVSEGRDLRIKQALHSLHRPEKISAKVVS